MYENFSQKSVDVMLCARKIVQKLNHAYLGTEHVLAGILAHDRSVTATVLNQVGVTQRNVNDLLQEIPKALALDQQCRPATEHLKQAIHHARETARKIGHPAVCPAHLLTGIIRVPECNGLEILRRIGAKPFELHYKVMNALQDKIDLAKTKPND